MLKIPKSLGGFALPLILTFAGIAEVPAAPAPPTDPEIFGPGTVSLPDRHEFCSTLSADRKTVYIGIEHGRWQSMAGHRWNGANWGAPFYEAGSPEFTMQDPYLSPDGERLYFITRSRGSADIAYAERDTSGGWGEPVFLPQPVNTEANEYYTSLTKDGAIIFASDARDGGYDLYSAEPEGEGYAKPELFPDGVNTRRYEADPFIDPDGRYLIFASNRPEGQGRGDIYIAFAESDGSWSDPVPIDERVNTSGHELCPSVTPDGKIFMYTSRQDIYWMSAAFIEDMLKARMAAD